MGETGKNIDFTAMVHSLYTEGTASNFIACGGRILMTDLDGFLAEWRSQMDNMPYRIWEYMDRVDFERNTLPQPGSPLEIGRLFGHGGDLSLRRREKYCYWRFVGPGGTCIPEGFNASFVATEELATLRQRKAAFLLWGKKIKDESKILQWDEPRVGASCLKYPWEGNPVPERVHICCNQYSTNGRMRYVWFTGLEGGI